jgi:hypothetical protein
MTRATYFQRRWPDTPLFQNVAQRWCADQSRLLLDLVWRGYDSMWKNDLSQVSMSTADEAKEESLNHLLALRIDQCRTGDEPFRVADEPPEHARRKRGRGGSPQPDIGFVWHENPNCVWPMEGKLLAHDTDLSEYIAEIQTNFLTRRYAAFSLEGAMLGYLLSGDPQHTLEEIAGRIRQPLLPHPHFPNRPHRVSQHRRRTVGKQDSGSDFWCHHLILRVFCS